MHFILAFGISFLLPVLLMLLERRASSRARSSRRARYAHSDRLRHRRRWRRPPDVISQFMLAVPLILLYELSLIAIWFTERRRARETARSRLMAEADPLFINRRRRCWRWRRTRLACPTRPAA
jgi:sec-independent protein translocase protein TatC